MSEPVGPTHHHHHGTPSVTAWGVAALVVLPFAIASTYILAEVQRSRVQQQQTVAVAATGRLNALSAIVVLAIGIGLAMGVLRFVT